MWQVLGDEYTYVSWDYRGYFESESPQRLVLDERTHAFPISAYIVRTDAVRVVLVAVAVVIVVEGVRLGVVVMVVALVVHTSSSTSSASSHSE